MRSTITDIGRSLLEQLELGEITMDFSEVRTGGGVYTSTESITGATELKDERNTYTFSSKEQTSDGIKLSFIVTNAVDGQSIVPEDYRVNEIGVYVTVDNTEYLYMIAVADNDEGNILYAFTGNNPMNFVETVVLTLTNTANVTVNMTGAAALASDLADLEEVVSTKASSASVTELSGIVSGHTSAISGLNTEVSGKGDTVEWDNAAKKLRLKSDGTEVSSTDISVSSGSTVTVTTEESTLDGKAVTLVAGGETYSATFSGGSAKIDSIIKTGTAVITTTDGVDTFTETLSIPYFGDYSIEAFLGTTYLINIETNESALFGQTVTLTNGSQTKTATIGSSGTVSTRIKFTGSVTVSASGGGETASKTIEVAVGTSEYSVKLSFYELYGAEWDGTSTTLWSRTDDAAGFVDPVPAVNNGGGSSPFDGCYPWNEMERVNDSAAGTLVKIPKFYYKWTRQGDKMKLQICSKKLDGFYTSPAHADRGDGNGERDVVYVGAYHCAASTYKSTTNASPYVNITRATARSGIHNLGSTIWQWDYAMLWTIQMLYLVEFADWNSQAKIGYGCGNNSSAETSGKCDAMTYHTGTNASSRTTYGHVRYRWIEDLWANVYDWCDGIYFSSGNVYCIKNPSSFSDSSNGTLVGSRATSSNYISKYTTPTASGFEYALYPSATSGTDSTYVCDYCNYYSSGVVLRVGGNYGQGQDYGLFYLVGSGAASSSAAGIGSRLQKLP